MFHRPLFVKKSMENNSDSFQFSFPFLPQLGLISIQSPRRIPPHRKLFHVGGAGLNLHHGVRCEPWTVPWIVRGTSPAELLVLVSQPAGISMELARAHDTRSALCMHHGCTLYAPWMHPCMHPDLCAESTPKALINPARPAACLATRPSKRALINAPLRSDRALHRALHRALINATCTVPS